MLKLNFVQIGKVCNGWDKAHPVDEGCDHANKAKIMSDAWFITGLWVD